MPDSVDLGAASAIPVAGVTALRALRALGPVVGRRVLDRRVAGKAVLDIRREGR